MNFVNTHRQALSIFFSLLVLVGSSFLLTDHAQAQRVRGKSVISPTNYASLVDPLIGTGQQALAFHGGDTFPGADVPFGMVQWSPDTTSNPDGGYNYSDNTIKGFSLTHVSGAGCNAYGDIPFMPYVGNVSTSPASSASTYTSTFSHANEAASAGYYQVKLDNGVNTQLTVTQHSGAGSFTYPSGQTATMLVNTSGSADGVSNAQVNVGSDTISGSASSGSFCGASDTYTIYFWAQFSQAFATSGTWSGSTVTAGNTSASGSGSGAFVTFDTSSTTVIGVRVGVSFVSVA
ncbi:MAG TPA: alpha-mannosidase, partial [Ktedonobacteraceae bacterium]